MAKVEVDPITLDIIENALKSALFCKKVCEKALFLHFFARFLRVSRIA